MHGLVMLYIFPLISYVCIQAQRVRITEEQSNSNEASDVCDLVTAGLTFSEDKVTVDIDLSDVKQQVDNGTKLWIGYKQTYAAFLHRGCSAKTDVSHSKINENLQPDPGRCFSFCQSPFIGIEVTRCYCLTGLPNSLTSGQCSESCTYPRLTSCGSWNRGIDIYEKVKYYQTTTNPDNADDRSGLCRAFEPVNQYYIWKNCVNSYNFICETGSNPTTRRYVSMDTSKSWMGINNQCVTNRYFPMEERHIGSVTISTKAIVWTGRLRSLVITEVSDQTDTEQGFRQGYVVYKNGKFELHFDGIIPGIRALCFEDEEVHNNTSVRPSNATTGYINSSKDSPVAVYIAVPIGVVIVAAVVGVVLVWRRRRNIQRKYEGAAINNHETTENPGAGTVNQDDFDNEPNAADDYYVIVPELELTQVHADNIAETSEHAYDIHATGQWRENTTHKGTGNIYNSLNVGDEDTYDHTNTVRTGADDTYNHLDKSACGMDGIYSHTDDSAAKIDQYHLFDKNTERNDDTYNIGPDIWEDAYNHTIT